MRSALDRMYMTAAWLAALLMIGLLIMVLLSIPGRQFGFHVRGTDAYAGYMMMAGRQFLALAHTLKRGEHIRVTLLLQALSPKRSVGLSCWRLQRHCCWLCCSQYSASSCAGSRCNSTISPPVTTLRRCGFRKSLWRWERSFFAVAFLDELVLEWQGRRVVATSDEALPVQTNSAKGA